MTLKQSAFLIGDDGKTLTKIDKLPEGAVRLHLYNFQNILRPRGPLRKESLSNYIYERLQSDFEDWTDKEHGDSRNVKEVINQLRQNLMEETTYAFEKFLDGLIEKNKIQLEENKNEVSGSNEETENH